MIDPAKRLDQIAQRQRDKMAVKAATAKRMEATVALGSSSPPDATPSLRTALFATQSNDPRSRFREAVVDQGPLRICYSGPSLNPTDRRVWEWLVEAALQIPMGHPLVFTASAFLQATGHGNRGVDHREIIETLARLLSTAIEVTDAGITDAGSLIASFECDETTNEYRVTLNPKMLALWSMG